jgi:MFS transporter, DHA3 family, multidrug efflux protein
MSTTTTRALDLSRSTDRAFAHLLVNTLLVSVINFTVWFAVTFWVFLETKSVLATGMVAGIFLVTTAVTGIWFGSLVDRYRKKTVMQISAVVSVAFYTVAFTLYVLTPEATFSNAASVRLWVFIVLAMCGVITGNVRSIALQTLVTVLIPEERRDKANGLVGTTLGVSFLHGLDGRVRAVAGVGAGLGPALGRPQHWLHHWRARCRQDRPW